MMPSRKDVPRKDFFFFFVFQWTLDIFAMKRKNDPIFFALHHAGFFLYLEKISKNFELFLFEEIMMAESFFFFQFAYF